MNLPTSDRNRHGGGAWVEAVTANPNTPYNHVNATPSSPPEGREALFFGLAALRFGKTLGNKLQRRYEQMTHVRDKPFVLALADFHAPASMLWSREGLIGYLYGEGAEAVEEHGRLVARQFRARHLHGPSAFPAGLFANADHAELSAVIFSNACSISKLNRVMISAGADANGLRYTRAGDFFDRDPAAFKGIPFCLDVTSAEYRGLWPLGYEPWSAEMEVFHNPFARHPLPHSLMPEATHWFEQDGERICHSFYETSILWSVTHITDVKSPHRDLRTFLAISCGSRPLLNRQSTSKEGLSPSSAQTALPPTASRGRPRHASMREVRGCHLCRDAVSARHLDPIATRVGDV